MTKFIYQNDNMLGHNTDCNKCKRIKDMQNMFSNHNRIKLEMDNRKISGKIPEYLKMK